MTPGALHPVQIGFDELQRELGVDGEDFEQRDAIEPAGPLRRNGDRVLPTRAALRLDELLGG